MAQQLEDLFKGRFSTMSYEEQQLFIQQLRGSRATPKATSKKAKKETKEKKTKQTNVQKLIKSLSDKEKLELLIALDEQGG